MSKPTPSCALITGASQGLGRALVEECAARGMDLVLVALPGSGLSGLSRSIVEQWEVSVDWLEADLTDPATPQRIVSFLRAKRLEIDLLVNNAGVGSIGFFADSPLALHEASIELNVLALVRLTRLLIPELARRPSARILNVASLSAFFPMPYYPVYSATKSFVVTFSRALRDELAGSIGVSVLCPNTIRADGPTQEFIDRLGLHCRLACLTAEQIARKALEGLLRNRAVIVPGLINRFARAAAVFVPRALVVGVIRRYWGGYVKANNLVPPESSSAHLPAQPPNDVHAIRKRRSVEVAV